MKTEYEHINLDRPASKDRKAHVTIRVPIEVDNAIKAFSADQGMSRTDAYVHFLEAGIAADAQLSDNGSLEEAAVLLKRALSIVNTMNDA